jgi:DNA-binding response OmpR family regulator
MALLLQLNWIIGNMTYQLHRISILVVEDNLPMLEITKSLLLTFGVGNVITATDGQAGFRKFCEFSPDIIIADWMMRPMDGISFTRLVRNEPSSPNPYVPVILMTGFSERRRVVQARDAGVTEFLVKPFNAKELYKRISQVIERPRQFVKSADFFGPDRRRRVSSDAAPYRGPLRRESDLTNSKMRQRILEQQAQAHETLRKIREKAGIAAGDRFNIDPNDIDFR